MMDSDDSNFYGDADNTSGLHARVNDFNVEAWIHQHNLNPGHPVKQPNFINEISNLHNPYAGVLYAWQLTETLEEFFARLPPATTDQSPSVPWIFICNPYIPRVEKRLSDNQYCKGNEDEAPEEEGSQVQLIAEGGLERLELFGKFIEGANKMGRAQSAIDREINKERKRAAGDILNLAHAAKVRAGKWMLFCPPTEINEVWQIVARATANNELGIAAKVAPHPADEDPRRDRLVCVYTSDFKDEADVTRVLQKLRELKLVERRGRSIYYKPDAFTYVGISSGNTWGMRASIYSSMDMFKK